MNPAIEQAVKALEEMLHYSHMREEWQDEHPEYQQQARDAIASLRALTEPVAVSKTDEELAIKLRNDVVEKLFPISWTDSDRQHHFLSIDPLITQAFTAIRAQARSEALEEAAKMCDRIGSDKTWDRAAKVTGKCALEIRKLKDTK